jgi:hypothetical protein
MKTYTLPFSVARIFSKRACKYGDVLEATPEIFKAPDDKFLASSNG